MYSVLPVAFPDLGDQTFGETRIDGTGGMLPISLLLAVTRVDDVLIFSTNAAVGGGIDAALLEDLTGTMVDRGEDAADSARMAPLSDKAPPAWTQWFVIRPSRDRERVPER